MSADCPECGGCGWTLTVVDRCCQRSDWECGAKGCTGPEPVQEQEQCEYCGGGGKIDADPLASVDTHPKDGDALAAPLVSGAVRDSGDAQ